MKPNKKPHPGGARREMPIYTAVYVDHPVARYNENPLIRALTPLPTNIELQAKLTRLPAYDAGERELDRSVKVMQLQQLFRFYLGLPRVAELMETLHAMICEGYLGREPYSPEDHERRQKLYEMQQNGEFYDLDEEAENGAEFTAALIGIPGIGKSQALKRVSKPYRRVIYHPELNIYQIPALLVEMPYKGVSVNTLAEAIIRALDKAYPAGNYYETYLAGRRENAEVLFMDAVRLMQTHYVGVLLVDESQNREYRTHATAREPSKAVKGQIPLTTLLLTATNESQIPMLMSGTPELRDMLGARMSMLRRIVGRGMRVWKPLSLPKKRGDLVVDMGEFDVFLTMLWEFQWTKTPFELTPRMRNIFYFYSQGISDVVVKLFHDVQLRAIRSEGEQLVDEALVHDVANDELAALTEMTRAMRDMDYDRTGQSADLAAYLRIDPHEMNGERRDAQRGLIEEPDPDLDEDDEESEPPEEAVEEPVEVPTGPAAKRPRRKANKATEDAEAPAPDITPVDDLNGALDE